MSELQPENICRCSGGMSAPELGSKECPVQLKYQGQDRDDKIDNEMHTAIQNAIQHLDYDIKKREYAMRNEIIKYLAGAMKEMAKEVVKAEMSKNDTNYKE